MLYKTSQALLEERNQVIGFRLIDFTVNLLATAENLEGRQFLDLGPLGNFTQRIVLNINLDKVNALVLFLLRVPEMVSCKLQDVGSDWEQWCMLGMTRKL